MVQMRHILGFEVRLFTCVGSHLPAERSGWFIKRLENAREVLIDNGVYHLLKERRVLSPREVVKYGYRNIMQILNILYRRDVEVHIVIPDYPFDRRLNYECYRLFREHFRHVMKDCRTVYVLHGYWQAVLDGVEVDLVAVPYNTLTDVPIRDLRGRRASRLDENVGKYVLVRTIEHARQHGYDRVHLLGPTGLTIRHIFKPLEKPTVTFDGVRIDNDFMRHIVSMDTTSFRIQQRDGHYLLPDRKLEEEWLRTWLSRLQWFTIVEW